MDTMTSLAVQSLFSYVEEENLAAIKAHLDKFPDVDSRSDVQEIVATAKFGDLIEFSYPIGYSHWGVYAGDGHVIHFAVAEEGDAMQWVRGTLEGWFPYCGDLLLGQTRIRRVPVGEVTVPQGAHVLICNNRHSFSPSEPEAMRRRCDALLNQDFKYDLFSLNCEHFATFVRFGKAVCNQIPTKPKNQECVHATTVFQTAVDADDPVQKLCDIVF